MDENPAKELGLVGIYPSSTACTVAETNTIRIAIDLINLTTSGDFFKVSAVDIPVGEVELSPSQYIFLEHGSKKQMTLAITPAAGSAKIYPVRVLAVRKDDMAPAGEAQITLTVTPAERAQAQPPAPEQTEPLTAAFQARGRIGVTLDEVRFFLEPGVPLLIPLQVTNQGLANDRFTLRLESNDIPAGWVSIQPAFVDLRSGQKQTLQVQILAPKKHSSKAGRYPFTLVVQSEQNHEMKTSVDCILTVKMFSLPADVQVSPLQVFAGQPVYVKVENKSNTAETYAVSWAGPDSDELAFTVLPPPPLVSSPAAPTQAIGMTRMHRTDQAENSGLLRVEPGKSAVLQFKAMPKSSPLLGRPKRYFFQTRVNPPDGNERVYSCALTVQPVLPPWALVALMLVFVFSFCALVWVLIQPGKRSLDQASSVGTLAAQSLAGTQSAFQTATAVASIDSDGDGLMDSQEIIMGTNPSLLDTDLDGLPDGDEVNLHKTDPKKADSDEDGLTDGDEIARGTNPLAADTDGDGLKDGEEVGRGTDPRAADSDQDGLTDGAEAPTCSSPSDPDSDDDGILDASDLDPCNRDNPSLTQTAQALIPTITLTPMPTQTPTPTHTPTLLPQTATSTPTATPPAPVLPGSLLFSSNREGRPQIYHRDMNTGSLTRLTVSDGDDTLPAWSPDGSKVAFTTNRDGNQEIYVMDANGANPANLSNHPADDVHPAWSPDGQWIAFSSNRDVNAEIYVMRADGSEQHNISNHAANDAQPFWGTASGAFGGVEVILFVTDRDSNLEIYSMRPDGSTPFNLTNNPASEYQPALSTDGGRIVFVSERHGNPDIFIMDTDGSDQLNLTPNSPFIEESPAWSADSQWVACSVNVNGDYELYAIKADGSLRYNITAIPSKDQDPAWR